MEDRASRPRQGKDCRLPRAAPFKLTHWPILRAARRNDGEALAAVEKAHPKRDEWVSAGCDKSVTLEVVNGLATRDELLTCAACGRILFLPSAATGGPVKART